MKKGGKASEVENVHPVGLVVLIECVLNGASYPAGVAALMSVFSKWIATQSKEPVLDAQVYGALLETIVDVASKDRESLGGAHDAAA